MIHSTRDQILIDRLFHPNKFHLFDPVPKPQQDNHSIIYFNDNRTQSQVYKLYKNGTSAEKQRKEAQEQTRQKKPVANTTIPIINSLPSNSSATITGKTAKGASNDSTQGFHRHSIRPVTQSSLTSYIQSKFSTIVKKGNIAQLSKLIQTLESDAITATKNQLSDHSAKEDENLLFQRESDIIYSTTKEAELIGQYLYNEFNRIDRNGSTVLFHSCWENYYQITLNLLLKGANPNIKNVRQHTPIHMSIEQSNINITKLLLLYGADCTREAYHQFVKKLKGKIILDCSYLFPIIDSDVSKIGYELSVAVRTGNTNIVREILNNNKNQANFNEIVNYRLNSVNLLQFAIYHGYIAIVRQLLLHGADHSYCITNYSLQQSEMYLPVITEDSRYNVVYRANKYDKETHRLAKKYTFSEIESNKTEESKEQNTVSLTRDAKQFLDLQEETELKLKEMETKFNRLQNKMNGKVASEPSDNKTSVKDNNIIQNALSIAFARNHYLCAGILRTAGARLPHERKTIMDRGKVKSFSLHHSNNSTINNNNNINRFDQTNNNNTPINSLHPILTRPSPLHRIESSFEIMDNTEELCEISMKAKELQHNLIQHNYNDVLTFIDYESELGNAERIINMPDSLQRHSLYYALNTINNNNNNNNNKEAYTLEIIESLIENGAEINVFDSFHTAPIHLAIENESYSVAELLINNGAEFKPTSIIEYMILEEEDERDLDPNLQIISPKTPKKHRRNKSNMSSTGSGSQQNNNNNNYNENERYIPVNEGIKLIDTILQNTEEEILEETLDELFESIDSTPFPNKTVIQLFSAILTHSTQPMNELTAIPPSYPVKNKLGAFVTALGILQKLKNKAKNARELNQNNKLTQNIVLVNQTEQESELQAEVIENPMFGLGLAMNENTRNNTKIPIVKALNQSITVNFEISSPRFVKKRLSTETAQSFEPQILEAHVYNGEESIENIDYNDLQENNDNAHLNISNIQNAFRLFKLNNSTLQPKLQQSDETSTATSETGSTNSNNEEKLTSLKSSEAINSERNSNKGKNLNVSKSSNDSTLTKNSNNNDYASADRENSTNPNSNSSVQSMRSMQLSSIEESIQNNYNPDSVRSNLSGRNPNQIGYLTAWDDNDEFNLKKLKPTANSAENINNNSSNNDTDINSMGSDNKSMTSPRPKSASTTKQGSGKSNKFRSSKKKSNYHKHTNYAELPPRYKNQLLFILDDINNDKELGIMTPAEVEKYNPWLFKSHGDILGKANSTDQITLDDWLTSWCLVSEKDSLSTIDHFFSKYTRERMIKQSQGSGKAYNAVGVDLTTQFLSFYESTPIY